MDDPVMIGSGVTYNRRSIEHEFKICKNRAEEDKEMDMDDYDYDSYFVCPLTRQIVDPKIMIPNKRILAAIEAFKAANPWAEDYDPFNASMGRR